MALAPSESKMEACLVEERLTMLRFNTANGDDIHELSGLSCMDEMRLCGELTCLYAPSIRIGGDDVGNNS